MTQLAEPQFDVNYPAVINFAGIGYTLAHEFGHSLDQQGVRVGPKGEIDHDIMLKKSLNNYGMQLQCIVDQYDQLEHLPNVYVDGYNTMNENLCDNIAIKVAYYGLMRYIAWYGKDEPLLFTKQLSGHFNVGQQYFITNAHVSYNICHHILR